ncbi:MAG: hypothetical protein KBT00_07010 [Bacteroidales bacterium]|nr:hypothetical protein [Candidatus Cacconaster merdequi]
MKRILTIAAAIMLLASPAANAQAFLNKLKEKAEQAIGNAISEKIGETVNEKVEDVISEKTGVDVNQVEKLANEGIPVPDSRETLQPKRSSSFGWDDAVTPSKAEFPIPLMNEFPAVPSAAQLANPVEADQIAYYKAIKAVTLRAEELNADTTCEDSFTEQWRMEAEKALQDAYGLTNAEMEALRSGTMSEAEEEALTEKMRMKILGGADLNQLEAEARKAEGMTESDVQSMTIKASDAVFDKYDTQLRKYFGCTAEEYKKATRESMNSDNSAASRAMEQKTNDYIKTLDPATRKEAEAFKSTLQKEIMQATMNSVPGAGQSLQIAQNVSNIQKQFSPLIEKYQKAQKYSTDIDAAWPAETWSDADAKFSASETRKIEDIKSKIYASPNPDEYNALFQQAEDLIRTYRDRAAKVWATDVQNRFTKVKDGMGNIIKIQRQAIADGVIPECALWRVPLNLVIEAGDILAEAYSNFPCNYPVMYNEEIVREITLQENEYPWWPEFFVADKLEDILAGKNMFKEKEGKIYQFNKGQWNLVPDDFGKDMVENTTRPTSASWKSGDGKREVLFNAEGGFIQLPEGDIIYPVAWDKLGNDIVWAENRTVNKQDGSTVYRIVKCTYKL